MSLRSAQLKCEECHYYADMILRAEGNGGLDNQQVVDGLSLRIRVGHNTSFTGNYQDYCSRAHLAREQVMKELEQTILSQNCGSRWYFSIGNESEISIAHSAMNVCFGCDYSEPKVKDMIGAKLGDS